MKRITKKIVLLLLIFTLFSHSSGLCAREELFSISPEDSHNICEPTVSEEEADVIEQVIQLSEESIDNATEFLKKKISPSSSSALDFTLGNLYFQSDKLIEAERSYREALNKTPGFLRARANLAQVLIRQDKIDEAIEEFRTVLISDIPKPSTLTLIGYAFLLKNRAIPAETAYRQALLFEPDDVNAYMGLAKSLLMQDRYLESIKILDEILNGDPYKKELWSLVANAYLAIDRADKAIIALETARRLKAGSSDALATLGDLYLNRNQPQEALIAYEEAFSLEEPSVDRLLRAIDGFLMVQDTLRAKVMIEKAQVIEKTEKPALTSEKEIKLRFLEARWFHIKGNLDEAYKAYKKILEEEPLYGDVLIYLGDLYKQKGKFDTALIYYERAERVSNKTVEALIRQAQVEVERGQYEHAVDILENAQKLEPQPYVERYLEQIRRFIH